MQYANGISYKYCLTELCILPYPFGLHRLPAPAPEEPQHWTRERLDTPRQHRSGRSASIRSGRGRRHGDSTTAAEPPRDQSQKRNARRARASTTAAKTRPPADSTSPRRAAEIEPEPESQKRGTVDHEQRQTETERRREKRKREGTKRKRQ